MPETAVPLYHSDPDLLEFDCMVLAAVPSGKSIGLLLDRSAFFPGGGGQPEDRGTIAGLPVRGFSEEEGRLLHLVGAEEWAGLQPGGLPFRAECRIDAVRRRDYQEQHTGEHLVAACLKKLFDADTVSVHFGETTTTIEIAETDLPENWIRQVEDEANRLIAENLPVSTLQVDAAELSRHELRRSTDLTGDIRLVTIAGTDTCACCGVHVTSLSSLRLVKILGTEKIRGRLRMHLITGTRVVRELGSAVEILGGLRTLFTCSNENLASSAENLFREMKDVKRRLQEYRRGYYRGLSADLRNKASIISAAGERQCVYFEEEFEDLSAEDLADFVSAALEIPDTFLLASSADSSSGKTSFIAAHNTGLDLRTVLPPLLKSSGGKGGGNGLWFQGVFSAREMYRDFAGKLKNEETLFISG